MRGKHDPAKTDTSLGKTLTFNEVKLWSFFSVSYVAFLEPFARRRRMYHYGNNMQGVMSHRENEVQ